MLMTFGEYKGWDIAQVPHAYLHWLYHKRPHILTSQLKASIAERLFPQKESAPLWDSELDEVMRKFKIEKTEAQEKLDFYGNPLGTIYDE